MRKGGAMGNRILKESICHNQRLASVGLFAENLFYRLIVNCDDYGNFLADPRVIKGRLFPLRENLTLNEVEDGLLDLSKAGLVCFYSTEDQDYLHLSGWDEHQKLNYRTAMYPPPEKVAMRRAYYS